MLLTQWAFPAITCSHHSRAAARTVIAGWKAVLCAAHAGCQTHHAPAHPLAPLHIQRVGLLQTAHAADRRQLLSKQKACVLAKDRRSRRVPACSCARDTRLLYEAPRMCEGPAVLSVKVMGKPLWVLCCRAASTLATDSTVRKPTTPVAMIISAVSVCSLRPPVARAVSATQAKPPVCCSLPVHHTAVSALCLACCEQQ